MRRFAALLALLACTAVAHADTSTPDGKGKTKPDDRAGAPAVLATLSRGACYGTCPIYKVTIYSDGRVEYDGDSFVKNKGRKTGTASPAALAALRKAFADAGYFKLDDHYDCEDVTDNPSADTSFSDGKRTKSVSHYFGCMKAPKQLYELEDAIDKAANAEKWVGTEKERETLRKQGKLR